MCHDNGCGDDPAIVQPIEASPAQHHKHMPQVIIMDGMQAYAYLVQGAKHVWCRFHQQQGVTH